MDAGGGCRWMQVQWMHVQVDVGECRWSGGGGGHRGWWLVVVLAVGVGQYSASNVQFVGRRPTPSRFDSTQGVRSVTNAS